MKAITKIMFLDENGEKFFGEGPCRLLHGIERTGSLRSAALEMGMAYTKALKLLKNAEAALGFPLTTRTTGGRLGGGSILTEEGKAWLMRYEAYVSACRASNQQLFRSFFPKIGCVIMASGMGKRFGSNKLLADFDGEPLFLRAVKRSEALKAHRIVVTRHAEIADLCREMGVEVLLHDLPHRSDTVRLGLTALDDLDACLFLPADQPLLRPETIDALIKTWEEDREKIVRPSYQETPSSPVLFPSWAFSDLLNLPEGKGGGWIIQQHPDNVKTVPVDDPFELMDADTPETLALLREKL